MEQVTKENRVAFVELPEQEVAEVQHRLDQYLTLLEQADGPSDLSRSLPTLLSLTHFQYREAAISAVLEAVLRWVREHLYPGEHRQSREMRHEGRGRQREGRQVSQSYLVPRQWGGIFLLEPISTGFLTRHWSETLSFCVDSGSKVW